MVIACVLLAIFWFKWVVLPKRDPSKDVDAEKSPRLHRYLKLALIFLILPTNLLGLLK